MRAVFYDLPASAAAFGLIKTILDGALLQQLSPQQDLEESVHAAAAAFLSVVALVGVAVLALSAAWTEAAMANAEIAMEKINFFMPFLIH